MKKTVFIGCGAGFADERPDAGIHVAHALAKCDGPRYIIYENLGERTLALAQKERHRDPNAGYTPQLESFLRPTLGFCKTNHIRIVGNFGAANPIGAGKRIVEMARELGVSGVEVAVVTGDDLLEYVARDTIRSWPIVEGIPLPNTNIISANAYIGAQPIERALATGADVVVLGRVTDSALPLGPLMHEFGWKENQWDLMAAGSLAGHLLECSAQVTGGYFADPGYKDVPDLSRIGFPIAEVSPTGECVITKPPGTGGRVTLRTVKEQMLYEMHDPSAYLVPDVTLDITGVELEQIGEDRVRVSGARGKPRPPTLKVTVCTDGGWLGEGEITYAGPNSLARAQLAEQVLRDRMTIMKIECPIRIDIIGTISTFDSDAGTLRRQGTWAPDGDYRVRIAGKSLDKNTAERVANELIALYTTGPAGGGGVRRSLVSRVQTHSALVDPNVVQTSTTLLSTENQGVS